jgi:hypothetical protein
MQMVCYSAVAKRKATNTLSYTQQNNMLSTVSSPTTILAEPSLAKCLSVPPVEPMHKDAPFPQPALACLSEFPVKKPPSTLPHRGPYGEIRPFPEPAVTRLS